jgi:hypothetical protein
MIPYYFTAHIDVIIPGRYTAEEEKYIGRRRDICIYGFLPHHK